MSNTPMQRNIGFKKILCFLDLPNAETGIIVDLLLKKNWHSQDLRFKIADFRFIIAKILTRFIAQ